MEGDREIGTAALRPIRVLRVITSLYDRIVVFNFFALVKDIARLGRIKHDRVPGFASRASDQGEERGTECLEVDMLVHFRGAIEINETELGHANDRKHEDEQHE